MRRRICGVCAAGGIAIPMARVNGNRQTERMGKPESGRTLIYLIATCGACYSHVIGCVAITNKTFIQVGR